MKQNGFRNISGSKYFVLTLIFFVAVVETFVSMSFEQIVPSATVMSEASLPTIAMTTEDGTEFNMLHGYTSDIDSTLFYGNITPISKDRKVSVVIHTYGEKIEAISYRLRSLEDKSLIENTGITGYTETDESISVTLNIKNLIDAGKEYALEIALATDEYEEVHYYTRIIYGDEYDLQDKIDFVLDFNACTFDEDRLSDIKGYLETSSLGDNTNYGKVDINCSLSQVGWGDLETYVESQIVPEVISVNDDVAMLRLDYKVGAANDYSSNDSYRVTEFYRIRQTSNGFYLLSFEREMNQVFDAKNDLTSSAKINLGINASSDVVYKSDDNGIYTCFVNLGSLWCFNSSSQTYTRIFSFEGEETDLLRESFDAHTIKIMEVLDSGDVTFMVAGYMNRGEHEGQVGVSLCTYSYADNNVTERLFIPLAVPYDILTENVGGVAYVSGDKFYILIDETLYSVDIVSKEVMTEIAGLKEGTYSVSEAGDAIAYSISGDIYNTDTLRVLNMGNNSDYEIKADEGDTLRALGYINSDFIYGTAHKSDITSMSDGSRTYAMYKIAIIDSGYNIIKEYEQPDIYVSDAEVEGMRVTLTRVVKSDDGYSQTSIDQLINKDENITEDTVEIEVISTDARLQEVYIALTADIDDISVAYRTSGEIVFMDDSVLELTDDSEWDGKYYAYGYGVFQDSTTELQSAINLAYDTYGTVIDSDAKLVWMRYRSAQASIEGIAQVYAGDSLTNAVSMLCNYAGGEINAAAYMQEGYTAVETLGMIDGVTGINLTGVTYEKVLSYVSEGTPVIAKTGSGSYVIITAYNSDELVYIDAADGSQNTITLTNAGKLFSQGGNVYVTYFK